MSFASLIKFEYLSADCHNPYFSGIPFAIEEQKEEYERFKESQSLF